MWPFLSVILGLGLVTWSLYQIRQDIAAGNARLTKGLDGVSDKNLERIIRYLDEIEKSVEEMNQAFYDLVSDLEGETALAKKEVELLEQRIVSLENKIGLFSHQEFSIEVPEHAQRVMNREDVVQTEVGLDNASVLPEQKWSRKPLNQLPPEGIHQLKVKIVELKKQGFTINQIAKALGVGVGELQLFIKLNVR